MEIPNNDQTKQMETFFKKERPDESYKTLRMIYNTLDKNTVTYDKFCAIIIEYSSVMLTKSDGKYVMMMYDIYRFVSDCEIVFSDGKKLCCLKALLSYKSEYFKNLFGDCDGSSINLKTDSQITISLIQSLYLSNIGKMLKISNVMTILKIMDELLIRDNLCDILNFIRFDNNITKITEYNCKEYDISWVMDMDIIFSNIICEDSANNNNKSSSNIGVLATNIRDIMFMGIGDYINKNKNNIDIFIFKNWEKIFKNDQIIKAIKISKKYELLNISGLPIIDIINVLTDAYPVANCYYNIVNHLHWGNSYVMFNPSGNYAYDKDERPSGNIIIIKSYYPVLEYTQFTDLCDCEYIFKGNVINFTMRLGCPDIHVGDKLLIGKQLSNDNVYTITEINKCYDGKKIKVDNAVYCYAKYKVVTYELIVNKVCPTVQLDRIWNITHFSQNITF